MTDDSALGRAFGMQSSLSPPFDVKSKDFQPFAARENPRSLTYWDNMQTILFLMIYLRTGQKVDSEKMVRTKN